MTDCIDQMRADFPLAARARDWSAQDQADIGAAIKAAIASNDVDALAYWSSELAEAAAWWRAWCERVRLAEVRARAAAQSRKEG